MKKTLGWTFLLLLVGPMVQAGEDASLAGKVYAEATVYKLWAENKTDVLINLGRTLSRTTPGDLQKTQTFLESYARTQQENPRAELPAWVNPLSPSRWVENLMSSVDMSGGSYIQTIVGSGLKFALRETIDILNARKSEQQLSDYSADLYNRHLEQDFDYTFGRAYVEQLYQMAHKDKGLAAALDATLGVETGLRVGDDAQTVLSKTPGLKNEKTLNHVLEKLGEIHSAQDPNLREAIEKEGAATRELIQKAAQAKVDDEAVRATAFAAARSTSYILSAVIGRFDSKLAKQWSAYSSAGLALYSAAMDFSKIVSEKNSNYKMIALGSTVFAGNFVSIGLGLMAAMGPSPEEMMAQQMQQLGQQIESLRMEMRSRLEVIDKKLDEVLSTLQGEFRQTNHSLDQLQASSARLELEMGKVRERLTELGWNVNLLFAAAMDSDEIGALNDCANRDVLVTGAAESDSWLTNCYVKLGGIASTSPVSPIYAARDNVQVSLERQIELLSNELPHQYSMVHRIVQQIRGVEVDGSVIGNPAVWMRDAGALIDFTERKWTGGKIHPTSRAMGPVEAAGRGIRDLYAEVVKPIVKEDTAGKYVENTVSLTLKSYSTTLKRVRDLVRHQAARLQRPLATMGQVPGGEDMAARVDLWRKEIVLPGEAKGCVGASVPGRSYSVPQALVQLLDPIVVVANHMSLGKGETPFSVCVGSVTYVLDGQQVALDDFNSAELSVGSPAKNDPPVKNWTINIGVLRVEYRVAFNEKPVLSAEVGSLSHYRFEFIPMLPHLRNEMKWQKGYIGIPCSWSRADASPVEEFNRNYPSYRGPQSGTPFDCALRLEMDQLAKHSKDEFRTEPRNGMVKGDINVGISKILELVQTELHRSGNAIAEAIVDESRRAGEFNSALVELDFQRAVLEALIRIGYADSTEDSFQWRAFLSGGDRRLLGRAEVLSALGSGYNFADGLIQIDDLGPTRASALSERITKAIEMGKGGEAPVPLELALSRLHILGSLIRQAEQEEKQTSIDESRRHEALMTEMEGPYWDASDDIFDLMKQELTWEMKSELVDGK